MSNNWVTFFNDLVRQILKLPLGNTGTLNRVKLYSVSYINPCVHFENITMPASEYGYKYNFWCS